MEQTKPKKLLKIKIKRHVLVKPNTNENEMNLYNINKRIENEFCHKTSIELTDERLIDKYKECPPVAKNVPDKRLIKLA